MPICSASPRGGPWSSYHTGSPRLIDCDLIMVLDKGRTVDIGPHTALVERCAIYRHLWLQQKPASGPAARAVRKARLLLRRGSDMALEYDGKALARVVGEVESLPLAVLEISIADLRGDRDADTDDGAHNHGVDHLAGASLPRDLIVMRVDKSVSARGKLISTASTIVVQPFATAIVQTINVQEGQIVHKGDVLATLDPTYASADLTALTGAGASLWRRGGRLQDQENGRIYQSGPGEPGLRTAGFHLLSAGWRILTRPAGLSGKDPGSTDQYRRLSAAGGL